MNGNPYGVFGRPIRLLEAYKEWRDERLANYELEEADSKADFPSFLFGPVRQSMWLGYSRAQAQYQRYTRQESAPDFRERRLRGLNGLLGIGYVGDHGHYPGMTRTERPPAVLAVDTYGGVYQITRQAIINDDSNELLNRNPADMGYAAGVFILQTVIALIENPGLAPDGQPFYSTARGNEFVVDLSEDSLADAITFMERQLDDDGRQIVITPQILVVQNARLQMIGQRILNSTQTGANVNWTGGTPGVGTAFFDKGTLNPLAGVLPADGVIRDPWFSDANDWYLFADPNDVPAFAVGFLNGQSEPQVMLRDPMVRMALGAGTDPYQFELDSVDFKVRSDFGVGVIDPRGALRSIVP
jgi:hypothetical protein